MNTTTMHGHCLIELEKLDSLSVQAVVTSPPYWGLRKNDVIATWPSVSYRPMLGVLTRSFDQWTGELGQENELAAYIGHLVSVADELWRVLKDDGGFWLNIGDSYMGSWGSYGAQRGEGKQRERKKRPLVNHSKAMGNMGDCVPLAQRDADGVKDAELCMIPARIALALQARGWWLRQDMIWSKPNPQPESVTNRCTRAHEYLYLFTKRKTGYYWDPEGMKEPAVKTGTRAHLSSGGSKRAGNRPGMEEYEPDGTRNRRSVWEVALRGYTGAHFATFPAALISPAIQASTRPGDVVLDPFGGTFTTAQVAEELGRKSIMIEGNPDNMGLGKERLDKTTPSLLWPNPK